MCKMWITLFILIFIASSLSIIETIWNKSTYCSSSAFNNVEPFKCLNGDGCISWEGVCDRFNDCADASDETFCLNTTRTKRANGCVLPPYPEHGIYEALNDSDAMPGQSRDSFVLKMRCRKGYGVINRDGSSGSGTTVYCVNGGWSQIMPTCVRFCRLSSDASISYTCHVPGVGFKVCDGYVAPGTTVNPVCRAPIYSSIHSSTETFQYMNCVAGFWDYFAECKAECGRVTPDVFGLIVDGVEAKRGELPWHVGVYRKEERHKQICGGSIVTNNAVISAAHCFWDPLVNLLPASRFAVAGGKLYSDWDSSHDIGAQKSDILSIAIPELFEGSNANFQDDVAILNLKTPFVYKTYIRPVCLNYDLEFDKLQLRHGNLGKVAGWGLTSATGKDPSATLKVAELPFVSSKTCIDFFPLTFRESVTVDKFCAGYTNGTAVCRGDSGGGLAFPDRELALDRFYLRGIVSTAPRRRGDDNECNANSYTTFTKITKQQDFIKDTLAAITIKRCPLYAFRCDDGSCAEQGADCDGKQDCKDGSDEADDLCSVGNGPTTIIQEPDPSTCVLPPYPDKGTYIVSNAPDAVPGQVFKSFVLNVICLKGRVVRNPDGTEQNSTQIYCIDGEWLTDMPECVPSSVCEWDGIKGKCVSPRICLSSLDPNIPKNSACAENGNETSLCCTDCELVNDTSLYVPVPRSGSFWKDGRKSRDACLDYLKSLPHRCHQEGFGTTFIRTLNRQKKCHVAATHTTSKAVFGVQPAEHPYEVLMGYGKDVLSLIWTTAGVIISEKFVLASSIGLFDQITLQFVALGVKLNTNTDNYQPIAVKTVYKHPLIEDGTMYNDISLVELAESIKFNEDVIPACLPEPNEPLDTEVATFHTWKKNVTQILKLQEIPIDQCYDKLMELEEHPRNYFKAFLPRKMEADKQLCYGQKNECAIVFGAGLVIKTPYSRCMNTVIGLNTHSLHCNISVFTKVQYYVPWIESIVWP